MSIQFQRAVKHQAKGRVALIGPAGSGKSYTMLRLAGAMGAKVAAVDTEHGSLSKYADLFNFDVIDLDVSSVENFLAALTAAETNGYDVFCCDSLSHFWMGRGGALEFVDMAAKRHRDQMGGWKDFRPHERQMVDRMIASPCHVIVTMRTKTDYVEQTGSDGKKKRVKVGLAPVQREGLEYEFDLVGYMDEENTLIVDKTRCPALSQKALVKPGPVEFAPFIQWLGSGAVAPPVAVPTTPVVQSAVTSEYISPEQLAALESLITSKHADRARYITYLATRQPGLAELAQLLASNFVAAEQALKDKADPKPVEPAATTQTQP